MEDNIGGDVDDIVNESTSAINVPITITTASMTTSTTASSAANDAINKLLANIMPTPVSVSVPVSTPMPISAPVSVSTPMQISIPPIKVSGQPVIGGPFAHKMAELSLKVNNYTAIRTKLSAAASGDERIAGLVALANESSNIFEAMYTQIIELTACKQLPSIV